MFTTELRGGRHGGTRREEINAKALRSGGRREEKKRNIFHGVAQS